MSMNMNKNAATTVVRLTDYSPPAFWVDSVDLSFDLSAQKTLVINRMQVRRNLDMPAQPLCLDGDGLSLSRIAVNGESVSFTLEDEQLLLGLSSVPVDSAEPFTVEIATTLYPSKNTQLMGLYVSEDAFFTQCEAQGFRRITYCLDRPDVMSRFSVYMSADKLKYPVLLSNGNLVDSGDLDNGRHFTRWVDPHKKPSYLFALVAGRFDCREQRVRTRLGQEHCLQIYVKSGDLDKTDNAMLALQQSVAWDEQRFGLSLDLERFMIVATSDFNMGAMENKGLNIFNTRYVLADSYSSTDSDIANVFSVVAHEYLHNWTGNRVTCRDWFQLSLKEGLTVFRDQEFSQDLAGSDSARAALRIEDVRALRSAQFAEDASPMAHSVRPDAYQEISNFYTATVYEKGAEVVRIMQTLVGRAGFRAGMDLYFQRHDGQAVTCDDFVQAIADANPDSALAGQLSVFKRWYSQVGTPRVQVSLREEENHWVLDFVQQAPRLQNHSNDTHDAKDAKDTMLSADFPLLIPIRVGLINPDQGNAVALEQPLFVLSEAEQSLRIAKVPGVKHVVPSLLRGFSAPVLLDYAYSEADLCTLLAHDDDAFNRWEAAQQLYLWRLLQACAAPLETPEASIFDASTISALRSVLECADLDLSLKALILTLPSQSYLADQHIARSLVFNPQQIRSVLQAARTQLAQALYPQWQQAFEAHQHTVGSARDSHTTGQRALANLALGMLCAQEQSLSVWAGKAYERVKQASNMTDRMGGLQALAQAQHPLLQKALEHFYTVFAKDALVLDKWFALQATHAGDVSIICALMKHPDFKLSNPNRARSVLYAFAMNNPALLHAPDGSGYTVWVEAMLTLDSINTQVAARLARAMDKWQMLVEPMRTNASLAIEQVLFKEDLSKDSQEVLSRSLGKV